MFAPTNPKYLSMAKKATSKILKSSKIFILDTNVLLHDFKCIFKFEENDVVLPIVVLEELDKFKKGNDLINFHAREFTRTIDGLSGDDFFKEGVSLGEGLGGFLLKPENHSRSSCRTIFQNIVPTT